MLVKILLYLICTISGLFLFKSGGEGTQVVISMSNFSVNISMQSLVGIIFYGFSFLLWLNIIKSNDLSYIFPVVNSLVTIFTVVGGIAIFHEHVSKGQIVGIILVIIGIFIVNLYK